MLEFKVNEYLSLRNDGYKTQIYVNEIEFIQCKFLLINIPVDEITSFDDTKSIDEATDNLDHSLEMLNAQKHSIDRKTEFWAHCSNLQVWAEHDYDTTLLHRNLSFPLLKKLTEVGDMVAKKVFKEEIAKRMMEGNLNVALYILEERYIDYVNEEEMGIVTLESNSKLKERIDEVLKREDCFNIISLIIVQEIDRLIEEVGHQKVGECFRKNIDNKLNDGNLEGAISLLESKYWEIYNEKEVEHSFYKEHEKSRKNMEKILKEDNSLRRLALLILKELAELGDEMGKQKSVKEFEKEFKRKNMPLKNFLLQDLEYYNYLDRSTMLKMMLEESDAKTILELDKLIQERWTEFKSELNYEEASKYNETYQREYLTLKPTHPQGERKDYSFVVENRKIIELNLRSMGNFKLIEFPAPVLNLTALYGLDLTGNRIISLLDGISNLRELKELKLNSCFIKTLPNSIGRLKKLGKLYLSSNSIDRLPLEFSGLESLKLLDLSNNLLETFPEEICYLELESLLIQGNYLKSLPYKVQSLESLRILDISYNPLEGLPKTVLNMDNLFHITIDASQKGLFPLKQLKEKRKKEKNKEFYIIVQ